MNGLSAIDTDIGIMIQTIMTIATSRAKHLSIINMEQVKVATNTLKRLQIFFSIKI